MTKVIVTVRFTGGIKNYEYYADVENVSGHPPFAVVVSPSTGLTVVKVMSIKEMFDQDYVGTIKPIVQFIDDTWYNKELEKKKRLANLEKHLDKLVAKVSRIKVIKFLVGDDPEITPLLLEYEELINE